MATISLLSKCANTLTDSFIVQSWILLTANPSKRDVESNTTPSEKSHQNGTAYLTQWIKKKKDYWEYLFSPMPRQVLRANGTGVEQRVPGGGGGVRWHQQPQWKSARVLHPLPHAHTLGRTAGERGAPNGHVRTMRIPGQLPLLLRSSEDSEQRCFRAQRAASASSAGEIFCHFTRYNVPLPSVLLVRPREPRA